MQPRGPAHRIKSAPRAPWPTAWIRAPFERPRATGSTTPVATAMPPATKPIVEAVANDGVAGPRAGQRLGAAAEEEDLPRDGRVDDVGDGAKSAVAGRACERVDTVRAPEENGPVEA